MREKRSDLADIEQISTAWTMPVAVQQDNWADKYQRSDHHKDRMVRNVLEYEEATGHAYPGES